MNDSASRTCAVQFSLMKIKQLSKQVTIFQLGIEDDAMYQARSFLENIHQQPQSN